MKYLFTLKLLAPLLLLLSAASCTIIREVPPPDYKPDLHVNILREDAGQDGAAYPLRLSIDDQRVVTASIVGGTIFAPSFDIECPKGTHEILVEIPEDIQQKFVVRIKQDTYVNIHFWMSHPNDDGTRTPPSVRFDVSDQPIGIID